MPSRKEENQITNDANPPGLTWYFPSVKSHCEYKGSIPYTHHFARTAASPSYKVNIEKPHLRYIGYGLPPLAELRMVWTGIPHNPPGLKPFLQTQQEQKKAVQVLPKLLSPTTREFFYFFYNSFIIKIWHWLLMHPQENSCKLTNEFLHRIVKPGIHRSPSTLKLNQWIGTPFSSGFTIRSQAVTLREKNLQHRFFTYQGLLRSTEICLGPPWWREYGKLLRYPGLK